jgi:calcineurin-like phosphoesterase
MIKGTPGLGMTLIKVSTGTIGVANIMTNLFMTRTDPVFEKIPEIVKYLKLNHNVNFSLVDVHGEASSEKMAIANALDGFVSAVVGTHTHVPTADHQILEKGTAYITDVGMSGDYNSIIGMNKDDALNRFMRPDSKKTRLEVSSGEPTLCGVVIETSINGLSKSIKPLRLGGKLEQVFLK